MSVLEKAKKIKELYLNGEEVIRLMQFLGYEFNKQGFTSIRAERTPSVSVRKNGMIKDFGSGWSGDIFDLLQQYHGLNFREAVDYIAKALNVSF